MVKKGQFIWNKRIDVRENIQEIIRLYKNELMSPNKIGEKYKCGEALIVQVLKENNAFVILSERRKILSKIGRFKSWNKGLTKETDERVKNYSNKRKSTTWCKNKEIIRLYSEDLLSSKQIAKIYGCSCKVIYHILRENGIKMNMPERKRLLYSKGKLIAWNKKPINEELNKMKFINYCLKKRDLEKKKEEIINLYSKGNSMVKISKLLNYNEESIKKILEKNDIKIRPIYFYNKGRISEKKGKTFEQLYGDEKSDKIKKKHSLSCTGEKNHQWQGGKSFEPYSKEFNKQSKKLIKQKDNNQCQECGITEIELSFEKLENNKYLRVHHIDYNKKNNSPLNLITLCNKCHSKTNFNREHWENYFKMKMFIKELFNPQNILIFNENRQLIGVERVE